VTRLRPRSNDVARSSTIDAFTEASARRAAWFDRWLAARLHAVIAPAAVRLELWDGTAFHETGRAPIGTLIVRDRRTLLGLIVNPDLCFGEAYMSGRLDIRGDVGTVVEALTRATLRPAGGLERLRAAIVPRVTPTSARRNVHHHYDLGNDFYEQWLDRDLVYTCAYFERPEMTLEEAQHAKFDLICRKLRLRPGERVVEAGCGWGTFALHMARQYGVRVKAFNVSSEQLSYARDRARREGLSDLVEFIDDDYRNVTGEYDVFVSVGMLEHVGSRQYPALSDVIRRVVRGPAGRGLLHFIGRDTPRPLNAWIRRRIFPGAYAPTLAEVATRVLGPAGMSIVDVENLRLHYARTLAEWRQRFAAADTKVRAQYGPAFARAWTLYLTGSQAAFSTGWMQLFQVLFTPVDTAPPYWARAELYQSQPSSCADTMR
jgi:cyclopropane-fatty-acyl-phospholipid synthase